MQFPDNQEPFNIVEVRFKNGRKEFFRNAENLPVKVGDALAVEGSPGHDIGVVSITGELVRLQMRRKRVAEDEPTIRKIYRHATQRDLDLWHEACAREQELLVKSREIARDHRLEMKISDVEMQGDGNKATFYYTAEERVDFRQLIRDYASAFRLRIEMRQIGMRQEAGRVGGIGSCGRELCCATWLNDFRSVNTAAARYQQLALNPQKLAGQCGKLKCCLNYELDSYVEALRDLPPTNVKLKTKRGDAAFMKMDIFGGFFWYAYPDEAMNWIKLEAAEVHRIQKMNKEGEIPEALEAYVSEEVPEVVTAYGNVVGQDSLNRFDTGDRRRKKNRKRRGEAPENRERKETQPRFEAKAGGNRPAGRAPGGDKKAPGDRPQQKKSRNRNRNRNRPKGPDSNA